MVKNTAPIQMKHVAAPRRSQRLKGPSAKVDDVLLSESLLVPPRMIGDIMAKYDVVTAHNARMKIAGTHLENEHELLQDAFDATVSEKEALKAKVEELEAKVSTVKEYTGACVIMRNITKKAHAEYDVLLVEHVELEQKHTALEQEHVKLCEKNVVVVLSDEQQEHLDRDLARAYAYKRANPYIPMADVLKQIAGISLDDD